MQCRVGGAQVWYGVGRGRGIVPSDVFGEPNSEAEEVKGHSEGSMEGGVHISNHGRPLPALTWFLLLLTHLFHSARDLRERVAHSVYTPLHTYIHVFSQLVWEDELTNQNEKRMKNGMTEEQKMTLKLFAIIFILFLLVTI